MSKTVVALLITLALASAQTSCVKVVNSTDDSPYPDNEPSLTFTMDGVTNFTTNSVSGVASQRCYMLSKHGSELSELVFTSIRRNNSHIISPLRV